MTAPASVRATVTGAALSRSGHWPLAFSLQSEPTKWWSHQLYRGPGGEKVEILYSRTKEKSEEIAQQFLGQPVLGFDMEWPWNDWNSQHLQNKIGLIQIACEDKIGLFHIGMHPGKTSADIIAPTLRRIIEDPSIGKVGVNILVADFGRLHRFFGLNPKGAVESSHLHRLVKFGASIPQYVSVKLVKLATQVEEELGLPLYKGDVRTSNWSRPLSEEQIKYAAGDAYAGFMLYHRMNAKRLVMNPVPPLPIYAERYPKGKKTKDDPILLDPGNGVLISSEDFFNVKITPSRPQQDKGKAVKDSKPPTPNVPAQPLDHVSQQLYEELVVRRASIAEQINVPIFRIIKDPILQRIARARPLDTEALLLVKGVGKFQVEKYGAAWLEVTMLFSAANGMDTSNGVPAHESSATKMQQSKESCLKPPKTPQRAKSRGRTAHANSSNSSPAFATPPSHAPQLHTGLSFNMGQATLDDEGEVEVISLLDESDSSLASLDFEGPPGKADPQLKRKRTESPTKRMQSASQRLQQPPPFRASGADDRPPTPMINGAKDLAARSDAVHQPKEPLTPRSKISRNKLLAFSRQIAAKLPARPAQSPPLVSEWTLERVVTTRPTSQEELEKIPGIDTFLLACKQTNVDLLEKIKKFAPAST